MLIAKPKELSKEYFFHYKNAPFVSNLDLLALYDFDSWSSFENITKERIEELKKNLDKLCEFQEEKKLKKHIDTPEKVRELRKLAIHLDGVSKFVHDLSCPKTLEKENGELSGCFTERMRSKMIFKLKKETLIDLLECARTVYAVLREEKFSDEEKFEIIEYMTGSILWYIGTGMEELLNGKMNDEEVDDLLHRKYLWRMYEEKTGCFENMMIGQMYKNFSKESIEKEAGCMYVIGDLGMKNIHIGITSLSVESKLESAMKMYRTKTNDPDAMLFILKTVKSDNAYKIERYLANKFKERVATKIDSVGWFNLNPEELAYLLNDGYVKEMDEKLDL